MADIASLSLKIDTGDAAKAVSDLDKLSAAGKRTEAAADTAGTAWKDAGQQINQANAGVANGAKAAATSATAAGNAAAGAAKNFGTFAAGQKLSAYQSQQLSFQLNDLFVQVASGQSPLTALIQQGSQLNGTFGGIGGTLRALSSVFTVTRVAIGGVVGAIAGVAFALNEGANQSRDFAKAILLTGNAAGVTEGQFNNLIKTVSQATATTAGGTRETLQALVASGRFTQESLGAAATAAQGLAKVTGQSSDDIVASFVKAANGVSAFAIESNKQYNYLSAAQLAYIKTLEDQGRVQEALAVTFGALNARIGTATGNLGSLERGWNAVKVAASNAIDAMLRIGRATTPEDAVGAIEAQLKALDERRSNNPTVTAARKKVLQDQLDIAKSSVREATAQAAASGKRAEQERAITAFAAVQDKYRGKAASRAKEIADATAKAKAAGASPEELAKVVKGISDKYKESSAGANTARLDAKSVLALQIEDAKSAGQAMIDVISDQDKVLEANRAAALIRDQDYYEQKTAIVQASTKARIDALNEENRLLNSQKLSGRDDTDRDRQVIKNQAEINKLQAQGATQVTVLGIQSTAATKKIADSYTEARAAAQSFLDVTQRQYDRDVAAQGLSGRARDRAAALGQIEDRYEQQRQQLESERRRGQLSQDSYNTELAIINEFQKKATDSYVAYYDRITDAQSDWQVGASRAYANYAQTASDTAALTDSAFTNAFTGLEDALVTFATTGKLSFSGLAKSIIADLARIQAKAAISKLFEGSNILGGLSNIANPEGGFVSSITKLFGNRAIGGPVSAGNLYNVNETGKPEILDVGGKQLLMMGNQGGNVRPLTQAAGGAGTGVPGINIVNQTQGRIDRVDVQRMDDGQLAMVISQTEDRIIAGLRDPNGRPYSAVQSSFKVQPNR